MPKIAYVNKRFQGRAKWLIEAASSVIDAYSARGYRLTMRQLYYQMVIANLLENQQKNYKWLIDVINGARLAGIIDWDSIEDRGRNLRSTPSWDSPADIVKACSNQFHLDAWEGQAFRLEVWVEKEALLGVVERGCDKWRVPYFACKGYNSQSEMWAAGHQRFRRYAKARQTPVVIHLGDHDPSGIDMTRDIADRLKMFAGCDVVVHRVALNWEQVKERNLPPNPAKTTDSRFGKYFDRFGGSCWELDALDPDVITGIIESEVLSFLDRDSFDAVMERENFGRADLRQISNNFDEAIYWTTSQMSPEKMNEVINELRGVAAFLNRAADLRRPSSSSLAELEDAIVTIGYSIQTLRGW